MADNTTTERVLYTETCARCGSENVSASGYGAWSIEKQEWVFDHDGDHSYCSTCQNETWTESVVYDKARWDQKISKGDLVNFHPDRRDYAQYDVLTDPRDSNPSFDHDCLDTALALVIAEEVPRKSWHYGTPDTVLVRLFTGETMEVWTRDLVVVGQMESGWELFGEKDDGAEAA